MLRFDETLHEAAGHVVDREPDVFRRRQRERDLGGRAERIWATRLEGEETVVREGIHRMYEKQEDVFYYLTVMNEPYPMPAMPDGVKGGILRGLYRFKASPRKREKRKAHLFGSGAILNEVLKAQRILATWRR